MGKQQKQGLTKKEIGDAYEDFSQEILGLKNVVFVCGFKKINFDQVLDEHRIEGISGAVHQIDVHLTSSKYPKYHLLCESKAHTDGVEKTHACSFVTVIRDIAKKHKKWKIIPAFTSRDGFDPGAFTILTFYKIMTFEMEDLREATRVLSISETCRSPIFPALKGVLEDGTIVDDKNTFLNEFPFYSRVGLQNALGCFELVDENGNKLTFLSEYTGKFKSIGLRQFNLNPEEDCNFYEKQSKKKLVSVEGVIEGKKETLISRTVDEIKSDVITNIKIGDGYIYRFFKDGSCKRVKQ